MIRGAGLKLLGIDTGGTFTDFVFFNGFELRVHKVLSTPSAPERAILQGITDLGVTPADLHIVHGSTVATNAVLEGKGVATVYVGNRGLADLLTIGRQARRELYNLQPKCELPPVPPEYCLETGGRLAADGQEVDPLTSADLQRLRQQIDHLKPRAVAINLLYSYLNDRYERAIAEALPNDLFVSRSSEVLPVTGEYERGIATWLNAWVGPLVEGYINRLAQGLSGACINVMQSSGEAIAAQQASHQAVRMLLSGPAGGLLGARLVAELAGRRQLLSFDMGGTSTDVALIDGDPQLTQEGHVGRFPVAVPMVDMHTIGAGGGSVARLDAGGMLQVGPESAGAEPGPASYGLGGEMVTVTDAQLLLGRLREDAFLGGRMQLSVAAARAAATPLAQAMETSVEEAALGIIQVANEHMARALRVISVQRGVDPRGFTLVCFGGAGGMHVCALAESLGMSWALVPIHAGVLSALGMLAARPGRQLSRTWLGLLKSRKDADIYEELARLAREGKEALIGEGLDPVSIQVEYSLDLRYLGQSYTLNIPWQGREATVEFFARAHQARYGHRLDLPVELVNLRARLRGAKPVIRLSTLSSGLPTKPKMVKDVYGFRQPVPVYQRATLTPGECLHGPAVVNEMAATTWLAPDWRAEVDICGNLLLARV